MRLFANAALISLLMVASSTPSQACGGRRGRCHCSSRAYLAPMAMPTCGPMMTAMPATMPAMTYGSPQMAAAPAPMTAMAPAPAPMEPTVAPAAVQPNYNYTAAPGGQPAYYYTYDNSGKLIVAQWMDWVFRGGRAAGEPAPPLPIIGALRNR